MCCQGTFRRRVVQLQAVLARGRRGLRCHKARLIHGWERLSPRNGLVHSSKRTKPCVIHGLPPSISSRSLRLSDNEPEVRQHVLHPTWLPFCYDCNVCGEALHPHGQLHHLPCPSAHRRHCFSQRRAVPSSADASRSYWANLPCPRIPVPEFFYQLCWHGSERFTKKEWTFLLASGRGDFGLPCNRCLVSIFPCSSMGACSNAIAAGITLRSVSLPVHQGLSNRGTELNYNAHVQSVPSPCKATLPQ